MLIHPNTTEPTRQKGEKDGKEGKEGGGGEQGLMSEAEKEARNHTERAIWMGERVVLNTDLFWEVMDH